MTRRGVDTAREGESLIDVVTSHLYGHFATMTTEEAHDFAVVAVEATIEYFAAIAERYNESGGWYGPSGCDLFGIDDWLRSHLPANAIEADE